MLFSDDDTDDESTQDCMQSVDRILSSTINDSVSSQMKDSQFSLLSEVAASQTVESSPAPVVQQSINEMLNFIKLEQDKVVKIVKSGGDSSSILTAKSSYTKIKALLSKLSKKIAQEKQNVKAITSQRSHQQSQLSNSDFKKSVKKLVSQHHIFVKFLKIHKLLGEKIKVLDERNRTTIYSQSNNPASQDLYESQNTQPLLQQPSNSMNVLPGLSAINNFDVTLVNSQQNQSKSSTKTLIESLTRNFMPKNEKQLSQSINNRSLNNSAVTRTGNHSTPSLPGLAKIHQHDNSATPKTKSGITGPTSNFQGKENLTQTLVVQKNKKNHNACGNSVLARLIEEGAMCPSKNCFTIMYKGFQVYANLLKGGSIEDSTTGRIFTTPEDWIFDVRHVQFNTKTSWRMVKYNGRPVTQLIGALACHEENHLAERVKSCNSNSESGVMSINSISMCSSQPASTMPLQPVLISLSQSDYMASSQPVSMTSLNLKSVTQPKASASQFKQNQILRVHQPDRCTTNSVDEIVSSSSCNTVQQVHRGNIENNVFRNVKAANETKTGTVPKSLLKESRPSNAKFVGNLENQAKVFKRSVNIAHAPRNSCEAKYIFLYDDDEFVACDKFLPKNFWEADAFNEIDMSETFLKSVDFVAF